MESAVARWHFEQTRNVVGSPYIRQFGFGHLRSDLAMAATCFLQIMWVEIVTPAPEIAGASLASFPRLLGQDSNLQPSG